MIPWALNDDLRIRVLKISTRRRSAAVLPDVAYRGDPADACPGIRTVEPILAID
jgi:hypothetical protein